MKKDNGTLINDPIIKYNLIFIIWFNIIFIGFNAIIFYSNYNIHNYPLSYLGSPFTPDGKNNYFSMIIFELTLIIDSILFFNIGKLYSDNKLNKDLYLNKGHNFNKTYNNNNDQFSIKYEEHSKGKSKLFYTGGAGFILMLSPCTINNTIHRMGSALVFASIFFFSLFLFMESFKLKLPFYYYFFNILNWLILFLYAIEFLFGKEENSYTQKYALLGIFINIILDTFNYNKKFLPQFLHLFFFKEITKNSSIHIFHKKII